MAFPSVVFSAIDECKSDVYFANGILTDEGNATANTDLLRLTIFNEIYNNNVDGFDKHIGKVDVAYNQTNGQTKDLLESLNQKIDGSLLDKIKYLDILTTLGGLLTQDAHDSDLELQVDKYRMSIKEGHRVLVVAHSQGNLFTGEAYKKLGEESSSGWMQDYFEVISVASPRHEDIKNGTPRINWDNDLVAYLALLNSGWVDNPVRKIGWNPLKPEIGLAYREPKPLDSYTLKSQVGGLSSQGDWESSEDYLSYSSALGIIGGLDDKVHAFTFYMGGYLKDDNGLILNYFDGTPMRTSTAKDLILTAIKTKLSVLNEVESQWETDEEFNKDTCNYKITVKHKFEPSIEMAEEVYPFAPNKKLYQVGEEWVKASSGGTEIKEEWLLQKSNECYLLSDTNETIELPLLGQGEINATISMSHIDPNKKLFISLTRTDYPHHEIIDTVEVDTNQSTHWHLFEGLEYGRYDSLVYSDAMDVVYDLDQVHLSEDNQKETMAHNVDMNYYEQTAAFTNEMISGTSWIVTNLTEQTDTFEVLFTDYNIVNNTASDDIGFSDGDTWQINSEGGLDVIYYFLGFPLTTMTHKITSDLNGCYKVDSSLLNSNWHGEYLMCQ